MAHYLVPPKSNSQGLSLINSTWNTGEGAYGGKQTLNETVTVIRLYTPESGGIASPLVGQAQSLAHFASFSSGGH
jgi:hypothetical protein